MEIMGEVWRVTILGPAVIRPQRKRITLRQLPMLDGWPAKSAVLDQARVGWRVAGKEHDEEAVRCQTGEGRSMRWGQEIASL